MLSFNITAWLRHKSLDEIETPVSHVGIIMHGGVDPELKRDGFVYLHCAAA